MHARLCSSIWPSVIDLFAIIRDSMKKKNIVGKYVPAAGRKNADNATVDAYHKRIKGRFTSWLVEDAIETVLDNQNV